MKEATKLKQAALQALSMASQLSVQIENDPQFDWANNEKNLGVLT